MAQLFGVLSLAPPLVSVKMGAECLAQDWAPRDEREFCVHFLGFCVK